VSDADPIRSHLREVVGRIGEDVLPPHYPTCLGCGPDAPQGFHLQVRRDGDEVVAEHVFEDRHSGAPGIAHGGAVATVVDDVLGFLLYVVRAPGVTRRLEVDYLKPVLTGVPYTVRGRLDRREGRKIWVSCACTDPDGTVAFRAVGLFVVVDLSHFSAATSGGGQDPVAP
jgi:acyl-coenzyme A thioesterase PaaI-like protein